MTKFQKVALFLLTLQTIVIMLIFTIIFMFVFDVGYITSELVRLVIADLR